MEIITKNACQHLPSCIDDVAFSNRKPHGCINTAVGLFFN